MRSLLLFLFGLLVVTLFGAVVGFDEGHIIITFGDHVIVLSALFFVVALFVLIILCCLLFLVAFKVLSMPEAIRRWRRYRRQYYAERYLTQGLVHMKEGNWKKAERVFLRAKKYSYLPYISYLLAARAAQNGRAFQRYQEYLKLAYTHEPLTSTTALTANRHLTAIGLQGEQKQRVSFFSKTGLWAKKWGAAFNFFSRRRPARYTSDLQQQRTVYKELLIAAGNKGKREPIDEVWKTIPRRLKKQPCLIESYVGQRLKVGQTDDCESILRRALQRQWVPALVKLYALITVRNKREQLIYMERMLKKHTNDPVLLMTLGKLSIKNELWGKAEKYLEDSIKLDPSPEAYYTLAALHERNEDKAAALTCSQKGLMLAINVQPSSG